MLAQLGVQLYGVPEMSLALSTLKISIQKRIVHSAVRSASGPAAVALRKQLRAISRASDRGTFTLARGIATKVSRSQKGTPTIKAITGAKRRVQGPDISSIARRKPSRRAKPLPSQRDEGKADLKKRGVGATKFRVPTRYFHFLERGFTNWNTGRRIPPKAPMRIAIRQTRTQAQQRFKDTLWRGIIRETMRANRYTRPQVTQGSGMAR